jgi:hypothetical protein
LILHQASDYQPSEDEQELGGERYLTRASSMLQSPSQPYGLPPSTITWVCKLSRFSFRENRWVDKGVKSTINPLACGRVPFSKPIHD